MAASNAETTTRVRTDLLVLVLVFGTIWGLSETVSGAALRMYVTPLRAAVLTGIGMALMGCFWNITRRPLLLPLVAAVCAASVQLSAPVLHCSLMCKANANLAVFIQGAMLSLALMTSEKLKISLKAAPAVSVIGFSAAVLSSAVFFFPGMRCAPCGYLLSFNVVGGFLHFLAREGLLWGISSAILLPAGMRAGEWISGPLVKARAASPARFYGGTAAIAAFSIVVIAVSVQYWH
jgi:hypothetical protein